MLISLPVSAARGALGFVKYWTQYLFWLLCVGPVLGAAMILNLMMDAVELCSNYLGL